MTASFDGDDGPRHEAGAAEFDAILRKVVDKPLRDARTHFDRALKEHHKGVEEARRRVAALPAALDRQAGGIRDVVDKRADDLRSSVDEIARRVAAADRATRDRDDWLVAQIGAIRAEQGRLTADRAATEKALTEMSNGAERLRRLVLVMAAVVVVQLVSIGVTAALIALR